MQLDSSFDQENKIKKKEVAALLTLILWKVNSSIPDTFYRETNATFLSSK